MKHGLQADEPFRYSYQSDRWHPHSKVIQLVGSGKRVLDVGCSFGYLAKRFTDNGCLVSGIEADPAAAEEAKAHCDVVHICSAESLPPSTFPEGSFDVIVYADVLEHMVDPVPALRIHSRWLSPQGYAVVSMPNVAFAGVRLHLLRGRFDYKDYGILDRTHLRFYTLETGRALLRDGGYQVKRFEPTGRLSGLLPWRLGACLLASGFVFLAVPDMVVPH